MHRVLILYNTTKYLVRFRQRFVQSLQSSGVEVHALTPEDEYVSDLVALGVTWHDWKLARHGMNPFADLASVWEVMRVMRKVRADALFNVTVKAVLYGGIGGSMIGIRRRVSLVAGLGNIVSGRGLRTQTVRLAYSAVLRGYHGIVVQNSDDECAIRELLGGHRRAVHILRVAGSGVDLQEFSPSAGRSADRPIVMMVTRLVWAKGLREFCTAAGRLRRQADFVLVGGLDSNPDSPSAHDAAALAASAGVELKLDVRDIATELRRATIFVYPSYYPEGIPRSVLEALGAGLPVITTDSPGCRESIEDGKQGYLVPPRDVDALERKLRELLADGAAIARLGSAARERAERVYDERVVGSRMAEFVLRG
jgi:glycosyltransferase involved in cell wall biosynthesis